MLPYQKTDLKKYQYFFPFYFFFAPYTPAYQPYDCHEGQLRCCVWCGELVGSGSAINLHHFHHLLQANKISGFHRGVRAD